MTVTRKDLNAIAATFNTRLSFHYERFKLENYDEAKVSETKAIGIWHTAEAMFGSLEELNPAVDYHKWRKAVTKGCDFDFLHHDYCRRVMTDTECCDLASDLIDNGYEFETVIMDDLNSVDVVNPITRSDWQIVINRMNKLEKVQ